MKTLMNIFYTQARVSISQDLLSKPVEFHKLIQHETKTAVFHRDQSKQSGSFFMTMI